MSDDGDVRETETCGGLESVAEVTVTYKQTSRVSVTQQTAVKHVICNLQLTFSSCGVGCGATWVAGEAACEAETACGEEDARWESAQP